MWNLINNYIKSLLTTFGYTLIYFFSYWQIKYNHLQNKLICDVKHDDVLLVELYDELNGIKNKKMSDYLNWRKEYYDTIIITKDTGIHPYDKIIINQTLNFPVELNWTNTKYKFLSLIAMISEDETYDIKLHSKMENYYILGNVIDNYFIKYYLEKYYKVKLMIDTTYMLQLIDQDVKVNILNMDNKIIFLENDYVIK